MADNISLEKMCDNDREQFIADNQYAFKYGIGTDEDSAEKLYKISEDEEVIDRETIEESIKNGVAYRIKLNGTNAGGLVIHFDNKTIRGYLDLLFVQPSFHSRGIGFKAWQKIEMLYPDIRIWETCTPTFEKRNIHFYINKCGFYIVEYFNRHHLDANENGSDRYEKNNGPDEIYRFEKRMF